MKSVSPVDLGAVFETGSGGGVGVEGCVREGSCTGGVTHTCDDTVGLTWDTRTNCVCGFACVSVTQCLLCVGGVGGGAGGRGGCLYPVALCFYPHVVPPDVRQ